MGEKIELGQYVRDKLTGLEGTVIARTEWLYGCNRITFQPNGHKDGKAYDAYVVDEPQLEVVDRPPLVAATPESGNHGDRPAAPERPFDPGR